MRFRIKEPYPIDYRFYQLSLIEYLKYLCKAALLLSAFIFVFYRSLRLYLFLLPLTSLYPIFLRKSLAKKRQHLLLKEFQEAMGIVSSFLEAGFSIENSFQKSLSEIQQLLGEDALILREWKAFIKKLEVNQTMEDILSDFAERSGMEDIHNFAEVFLLAKRTGGELPQIIKSTSSVIRDKFELTEEILTMNAAKRYEQKIMNYIPFFIIIYMNLSAPDFFGMLYQTMLGRVCMTVCLGLYFFALYLSEKILRIEV